MVESEPQDTLNRVVEVTDQFLDTTAGKVADRIAGAGVGAGVFLGVLYGTTKLMGVDLDAQGFIAIQGPVLTAGSAWLGQQTIHPVEIINRFAKAFDAARNG